MKTYVIGLTTYREIVRRPLFWLITLVVATALVLFIFIPYHTFGEDIKMLKDNGLAVILLAGLVVGVFAASASIAEEIEGRTAITLLSKPINRREFIIGKFAGIITAIALLFAMLSAVLLIALFYKAGYDARENAMDLPPYAERIPILLAMLPGIVLTYFKVTILVALSVAFSTRFPLPLNLSACIAIYLLGHLAPQLVQASEEGGVFEAVAFMAQIFATVLPGLEYFNIGPAIATDAHVPWLAYVLPCFLYCGLYTFIALMLALLMFEDRDLA
jgi:ABC-type transport system involved in multi-copper enzyme maturation permease subunit